MTSSSQPLRIGFLVFPQMTQLDVTGPAQVLAAMSGTQLHFIWKDTRPVMTDAGFALTPTHALDDCPALDMLVLPGGAGQVALMRDPEVIGWIKRQGEQAQWVTSVCSGALLLGAAGLLQGYRAATHWAYREHLPHFGAHIDTARVCRDRNRITGGGVTAGIDFGLAVVAEIRGEEEAREIQLFLEYAPAPPFDSGRPETASAERIARVRERLAEAVAAAA